MVRSMTATGAKEDLHRYLREARETLLWKLDGLSEYDVRRPMVPTGTNLLGLVKHVASVEAGYLGETFGRPFDGVPYMERFPWYAAGAEPNADMWATADEFREEILDLYRRVWAHSDATIEALPLEAIGDVTWWKPGKGVTLNRILVHVIAETNRHAGQADIVREMIDGAVGWKAGSENLPPVDAGWWEAYRQRLEEAARRAAGQPAV